MEDWKKVVKSVAPTIGLALGGPFAGAATAYLSEKLFGDENVPEKNIEDFVLSASPDKLVQIRQIDADFKVKMEELKVRQAELVGKNVDSARRSGDTVGHWPQIVLGFSTVIGFFVLLVLMIAGIITVEESLEKFLYMMIGSLLTWVAMVFRYFFGGSQTDERNMEKIYNSIPKG